jgi:hypothetical protein
MRARRSANQIDRRGNQMENPIEVVRRFCAAWSDNVGAAELASFTDDAVYHNIPLAWIPTPTLRPNARAEPWRSCVHRRRRLQRGVSLTSSSSSKRIPPPCARAVREAAIRRKLWMMFEPIVEPVVVGFKPDEDARWPSMTRDHDFVASGKTQVFRQIVLNLGQGHLSHSTCLPRRVRLGPLAFR